MTSPPPRQLSMLEDEPVDGQSETSPQRPLSGPGTSRHTRRLQLRNAGFRGADLLPARKVSLSTPAGSSGNPSSDNENVSPSSGRRADVPKSRSRESTGVLQEIGPPKSIKPKRVRPRLSSSGRDLTADTEFRTRLHSDDINSPPPLPRSAIRLRAIRARTKVSHPRRSISAEARKYVEHLEAELSAAQTEINAINSPSVTRVEAARMRHLQTESKQLQEELADWQAKFEERVREGVAQQFEVETTLRTRVRVLEREATDAQVSLEELRSHLEAANRTLEAVEAANVNLEKRLEIMSELLVASPSKIDLHADRPLLGAKPRPRSMLPLFPTAGTLIDRQNHNQPSSPPPYTTRFGSTQRMSVSQINMSPDEAFSDVDSVFSGATMSAQSGADNVSSAYQPKASRSRMRRMRRFGAGSMGPKPLLLPSTSHGGAVPASAPALERGETQSVFSFDISQLREERDGLRSPTFGRRRALTSADELPAGRLSVLSPFMEMRSPHNDDDIEPDRSFGPSSPPSAESDITTRDFSSLGSAAGATVGRNLMDELAAAKSSDVRSSSGTGLYSDAASSGKELEDQNPRFHSSPFVSDIDTDLPSFCPSPSIHNTAMTARQVSNASTALAVARPLTQARQLRARSSSQIASSSISPTARERLTSLFSDFRNPHLAIARHLIHAAQARMQGSGPMLNIQWWLVGMLLGPMARRRMLGTSSAAGSSSPAKIEACRSTPRKRNDPSSDEEDEDDSSLSYGDMYLTPSPRRSSLMHMSGPGRKRASPASATGSELVRHCPRHGGGGTSEKRHKHSPWLWLKFSITLAMAVSAAFRYGPGSLLAAKHDHHGACRCARHSGRKRRGVLDSATSRSQDWPGEMRDVFASP